MENNKLLIGVQFTELVPGNADSYHHYNIELYVVRDITLHQLLEGIMYGLQKQEQIQGQDGAMFRRCRVIYNNCISYFDADSSGHAYLANLTLTSFNQSMQGGLHMVGNRWVFYMEDLRRPICDLGFITSTRLIFDSSGTFRTMGMQDTSHLINAFRPGVSTEEFFPEYNISTRQLILPDTTPVEIIPPSDPPKRQQRGLFFLLLPTILTMGVMVGVRYLMMSTSGSGNISMLVLTAAMGITAVVTTVITYMRQKKEFRENLRAWREHYQDYIDRTCEEIRVRQQGDVTLLNELYPDVRTLMNRDGNGIYALNGNLYSRSPNDSDFLTFRVGLSDDVRSLFEIKGDSKDAVFTDTSFELTLDETGRDRLHIYLQEEDKLETLPGEKLFKLPAVLKERYTYLTNAPLLYSMKNTRALGVVDLNLDAQDALSHYFLTRMIFELCYYQSPEDLQFIIFFRQSSSWDEINQAVSPYKFMPHFRGLFSDKAQFVFDSAGANRVLSSLLNIMNERAGGGASPFPHIVLVVYEEHGLKEHAFAQYLPQVPEPGKPAVNELGLTFVFAKKYREYLPPYCDDVVAFDETGMSLTPRADARKRQMFRYTGLDRNAVTHQFYVNYLQESTRALRFFSSIYYARIAQNGKVPSAVSFFGLLAGPGQPVDGQAIVRSCWGISGRSPVPSVTSSLRVPIGMTETGMAYLDLHESADGPHMLVAGTTGSGKTETVISYLLALCMQYRPDELNLLLVDMKGGGFTKRIGHLPHVVGAVTDVDGDENGTGAEYMLRRFLSAMSAEIRRRKILFNQLHVDSIDGYIRACRDINAHIEQRKLDPEEAEKVRRTAKESPLSHLFLVVDEFTELKRFSSENSDIDFIGEITTIARVGRSLGLHIILISQNIEGAITEDIRVNCRARLCLKVATRQASKEMLGTDVAASPFMPGNGRAYLLVGTGSKFEYFQSGYSGSDMEESIPVQITLASSSGPYSEFYNSNKDNKKQNAERKERKKRGQAKTQLEYMCEAICAVYQTSKGSIPAPHVVFRAPLPTHIVLDKDGTVVDLDRGRRTAS